MRIRTGWRRSGESKNNNTRMRMTTTTNRPKGKDSQSKPSTGDTTSKGDLSSLSCTVDGKPASVLLPGIEGWA